MAESPITSRSNARIKMYKRIAAGKERSLFLIEGVRLLEEALSSQFPLREILYSEMLRKNPRGRKLLAAAGKKRIPLYPADGRVLDAISDVKTSQGILAFAEKVTIPAAKILGRKNPFLLVCSGLSDPGNLGALVRTAEAAGVDGALLTRKTVSPFHPKSTRASMGSVFRLPFAEGLDEGELLDQIREKRLKLVLAVSRAGVDFRKVDYRGGAVICLGGEAEGLSKAIRGSFGEKVTIPLSPKVESLNVAAAGAVLLFEAARQRKSI